jgi:hypothetical protein
VQAARQLGICDSHKAEVLLKNTFFGVLRQLIKQARKKGLFMNPAQANKPFDTIFQL